MKPCMLGLRLSHSGQTVHIACANQAEGSLLEGHVQAFAALGSRADRDDPVRQSEACGDPGGAGPGTVRVLPVRGDWLAPRLRLVLLRTGRGVRAHEKVEVQGEIGRFRRRRLRPVPWVHWISSGTRHSVRHQPVAFNACPTGTRPMAHRRQGQPEVRDSCRQPSMASAAPRNPDAAKGTCRPPLPERLAFGQARSATLARASRVLGVQTTAIPRTASRPHPTANPVCTRGAPDGWTSPPTSVLRSGRWPICRVEARRPRACANSWPGGTPGPDPAESLAAHQIHESRSRGG